MKLLILNQLSLHFYSFLTSFSINTVLLPRRGKYITLLLDEVKYKALSHQPSERNYSQLSIIQCSGLMVFTSASLSRNISGKFSRNFKNGSERPWKAIEGHLRHRQGSGRPKNAIWMFLFSLINCKCVLGRFNISGNFREFRGMAQISRFLFLPFRCSKRVSLEASGQAR